MNQRFPLFDRQWMTRSPFLAIFLSAMVGASALPVQAQPASMANSLMPKPVVESNAAIVSLAKHLKQVGAKMYGAYWCPHCQRQEALFGKAVFEQYINYIECDPGGTNAKPQVCQDAKITGYPTWEIKGKRYMGTQTLEELAIASGYKGSRSFGLRHSGADSAGAQR